MAPKKPTAAKQDKAKMQAKQKAVEDATFGMKNKNKSAKVQKYVQQLHKQVENESQRKKAVDPEQQRKERKAAEEARKKEMQDLLVASIVQPKVPVGVDPKSIVCEYFRQGVCTKGFKCKFAHNLEVERKAAKIDLYTDRRQGDENEEGMEDWDQAQLESVVNQKHGAEKQGNQTEIICKFFLEAVENRKYGWFWQCPNGKDCKYRHALPPGYVLKSQMKELLAEEAANRKDVAELIEEERAKVDAKTPITSEVFAKWHAEQKAERDRRRAEKEADRRKSGIMTGRELFMQEGFIAQDDASAQEAYEREDNEEEEIQKMHQQALVAQEEARRAVSDGASPAAEQAAGVGSRPSAGPSASSNGLGPSNGPASEPSGSHNVQLTQQEEEELFGDDDDDLDDDELEELEASLQNTTVS